MFRQQQKRFIYLYTTITTSSLKNAIKEYNASKSCLSPTSDTMKNLKSFFQKISDIDRYFYQTEFLELMKLVCPGKNTWIKNQKLFISYSKDIFTKQKPHQKLLVVNNLKPEPGKKTTDALKNFTQQFGLIWPALAIQTYITC